MPLIHTIQIYPETYRLTKIGIWHITEEEAFFQTKVAVASTVTHPHKRLQHLAARYLLTALEEEFPLNEIVISPSRKPYLPNDPLHFSVAHCGDYAVAIVSRKYRVGIDVEKISTKIERVAAKFLNDVELEFITKTERDVFLTTCWSAKEAVFKWYGAGGLDFKKNMLLQPFMLLPCGMIHCIFKKNEIERELKLAYRVENDLVVTWLVDDNN